MPRIRIERTKPATLACVAHYGGYDVIPLDTYLGHLRRWAEASHIETGARSVSILYDCPNDTPPWRCRNEIGIPIRGPVASAGEIHVKEMPAMDVMAYRYDGPA